MYSIYRNVCRVYMYICIHKRAVHIDTYLEVYVYKYIYIWLDMYIYIYITVTYII